MSEPKKLYRASVPQAAAKDTAFSSANDEIFFLAPIDLLADDVILIDPSSGQPLAIYRDNHKIWEFEGVYLSGSVSGTFTPNTEALAALMGRLAQ